MSIPSVILKEITGIAQKTFVNWKAYRLLRALTYLIIIIVALAAWVQISISPESSNPIAEWIYNFLKDWAVALGAAVTLLLVIAAFLSILDSRMTRMLDRNERLAKETRNRDDGWLKEIIDWANHILSSGLSLGQQGDFKQIPENVGRFDDKLSQDLSELSRLFRDGVYIKNMILPEWKDLHKKVQEMRRKIIAHIKIVEEYRDNVLDKSKYEKANKHRDEMNIIAADIIEEAQNIRKKLIIIG
ncbi:hypothetical protein ACFLX7_00465 [Chloroflexota bacterium]